MRAMAKWSEVNPFLLLEFICKLWNNFFPSTSIFANELYIPCFLGWEIERRERLYFLCIFRKSVKPSSTELTVRGVISVRLLIWADSWSSAVGARRHLGAGRLHFVQSTWCPNGSRLMAFLPSCDAQASWPHLRSFRMEAIIKQVLTTSAEESDKNSLGTKRPQVKLYASVYKSFEYLT